MCLYPVLPGEGRRSTDTAEFFSDERYRLPVNTPTDSIAVTNQITNVWNSVTALADGNAQLFPGADEEMWLVYPQHDFNTGWSPRQPPARDYSGFSGPQAYVRTFLSPGPRSAFTLYLGGVGPGQLGPTNTDAHVWVEAALPATSGWNDIFDYGQGKPSIHGSIEYDAVRDATYVRVVLGGRSTGGAGNRVLLRVSLNDQSAAIRDLEVSWE